MRLCYMEVGWKVRMNIHVYIPLWSFLNFCCLSQSEVWYEAFQLKANGLTSPPNDAIILTETRSWITASMISPCSFLKTLVVGSAGVEATTSRSADQCSTNCANRAALIHFVFLQELFISLWTCLLFSSSSKGFTPSTERNILNITS